MTFRSVQPVFAVIPRSRSPPEHLRDEKASRQQATRSCGRGRDRSRRALTHT